MATASPTVIDDGQASRVTACDAYRDEGAGRGGVAYGQGGHTGVDVPVYAWGAQASRITATMDNTDFFDIITLTNIAGDLNGDGFVGVDDLNLVLTNWNQSAPSADPLADPSGDGYVGVDDLNKVLANWNAGTPPANDVTIPEPTTLALFVSALGVSVSHRRRMIR